ncbi:MAG: hypothetical protein ACJAYV_002362 [Oleispira sp.]|jgi:hypothetical protein
MPIQGMGGIRNFNRKEKNGQALFNCFDLKKATDDEIKQQ